MTDRSIVASVYTDGACKGNPGPGGWGVFVKVGAVPYELCGGELGTTNNRMELKAAIEALKWLAESTNLSAATIYMDSEYVRKGITEWLLGWKAKGWTTSTRQPVKNADLWKELDALLIAEARPLDWRWVKGHAGDPGNERADQLANRGVNFALGRVAGLRPGSKKERATAVLIKHLPVLAKHPQKLEQIVADVIEALEKKEKS